jgi:protein-S-isoprenylcysteine O-methyltransferase Ste14
MKYITALTFIVFLIGFSVGVPLLGWGLADWQGFFANRLRLFYCLVVGAFALSISLWLVLQQNGYDPTKPGGIQSKRVSRQNIVPALARLAWLVILLISPYSDRHGWAVIGSGETVRAVGLSIFILGLAWVAWAFLTLGMQHSGSVTIQPEHRLVTSGPYRWIRHPMYLGLIVFPMGIGLVFRSQIGAALPLLLIGLFAWRIGDEERLMRQEFGEQWEIYCKKTWRMIPFLY